MATPIDGKLEVTIKINGLPESEIVENNWHRFYVYCNGDVASITVKPKVWKKLEQANQDYPQWVAAIAGTIGEKTPNGFILDNPNIQVFEKKPKETKEKEPATTSA